MGADGEKSTGRLRKYNERLFAVFGSLGAVLFFSLLMMLAYSEIIKPLLRSSYEPVTKMISDDEAQKAAEQGVRLQAASFEMAARLLEDEPYFVIPVTQRTLAEPETTAHFSNNFSDGFVYVSDSYYWQHTNNLVIWNRKTGATDLVLPVRRRIESRQAYIERGEPYLLVNARLMVDRDQADGKKISDWALWIYGLDKGSRISIELPGKVVLETGTLDESKLAFALVGEDRNGDGFYDAESEPTLLYRINAEAGILSPMVPDALRVRIQNILDGRSQEAE